MTNHHQPPSFASALFVIDVQHDLATGSSAVPDAEKIRHAIGGVLELARKHNDDMKESKALDRRVKIVFVQHDDSDPDDPLYKGKESWNVVFPPRSAHDTEVLVHKDEPNTFASNPRLAESLHGEGITRLAITGLQSDVCVRSSTLGAIESGFKPSDITVLQGAHSTYDSFDGKKCYQDIKKAVEEELAAKGVRLLGWREYQV